jgi:hypothetical protein
LVLADVHASNSQATPALVIKPDAAISARSSTNLSVIASAGGLGAGGLWWLRAAAAGVGPEDGLDRAVCWAFVSLAFLKRSGVVLGVAEVGVGTAGEQQPDACGPAVSRGGVQSQPPPFGIGFVDWRPRLDELVDHVQPLVVSCEH